MDFESMLTFLNFHPSGICMLDVKEFSRIQKDLEAFDTARERQIRVARDVIKLSKLVIYSLHRNDVLEAKKHAIAMQKLVKLLSKSSYDEGIGRVAFQEYVEAMAYLSFMVSNKIPSQKNLNVLTEDYLMGLCDFTGELVRRAVQDVIRGNRDDALKVRNLVEELYGMFLKFNLRNGELRKKADSIQWNLKKLDEIALGMKLQE